MKKTVFAIVAVLLCTAFGRVWYVHPDSALDRIRDGLDSCATGDTVLVGAGTYYENISWPSVQGVKLLSESGREMTLIDGGGVDRVIDFPDPVDTTTVVSGFTITNGYAEFGAGVRCDTLASPLIEDNFITQNIAYGTQYGHGGGIGVKDNASPVIRGNIISRNRAAGSWSGGGGIVCIAGSAPVIEGNSIEGNWSSAGGGGIFCHDYSAATITGNTIRYDTSNASGAGICCQRSRTVIYGNTITHNCDPVYPGGGISTTSDDSSLIRRNEISSNNGTAAVAIINRNNGSRIDSCTITDNQGVGIYCDGTGVGTVVRHCNITGNAGYAVEKTTSDTRLDASENWWGHATGPYHLDSNPGGLGDTASDHVDFAPWESLQVSVREISKPRPDSRPWPSASLARGVLVLGAADNRQHSAGRTQLLDIAGRPVMVLKPGANDVRHLSPGVYFVRGQDSRSRGGEDSRIRKVVLTE